MVNDEIATKYAARLIDASIDRFRENNTKDAISGFEAARAILDLLTDKYRLDENAMRAFAERDAWRSAMLWCLSTVTGAATVPPSDDASPGWAKKSFLETTTALFSAKLSAERELEEVRRRLRVAVGKLGVADCDDAVDALEEIAEEQARRDLASTDEFNKALFRAQGNGDRLGYVRGLKECLGWARACEADCNNTAGDPSVSLESRHRYEERTTEASIIAKGIEDLLEKAP